VTLGEAVDELERLAREGAAPQIAEFMDMHIPGSTVRSTPPPDINSID